MACSVKKCIKPKENMNVVREARYWRKAIFFLEKEIVERVIKKELIVK